MIKIDYLCDFMNDLTDIAVLGSTGSIGTQALDVIKENPDKFRAAVLIAGSNVSLLASQALEFNPKSAIIADETLLHELKVKLDGSGIECKAGISAICEAVSAPEIDMVLSSTVGYSGLIPTIAAIKAGKEIALANKETLVVAGELVTRLAKENNVKIYPVDSEHSAIYQCLVGEDPASVKRLIITASGGPFRVTPKQEMANVTLQQALNHPNWSMGNKITIDSATMMNKAFEIIEAHWLFDVAPSKITAVIHPQSIIHSMVEFCDGAVKAQLGQPDMHLPIRYALAKGKRITAPQAETRLNFESVCNLTFEIPDREKFPCLSLASRALEEKGNTACIINAANEIAVDAFLHERIRFVDIYDIIENTLASVDYIENPDIDDYVTSNSEARRKAIEKIKN